MATRAKENQFDEREREEQRLEYQEELNERAQRLAELRKERIEPLMKKKRVKRSGGTRKRKCTSKKTDTDGEKSARLQKPNTSRSKIVKSARLQKPNTSRPKIVKNSSSGQYYRLSGQEPRFQEHPETFKVLPSAEKGLHRMPTKSSGYWGNKSKEQQVSEETLPIEPASTSKTQEQR